MEIPQLVLFGDGGVGKTSIIIRYTRNQFDPSYSPTLEDNYTASIILKDGKKFDIKIADTAGQDDYKSLRDRYMDIGDVFMIVFSIDKIDTLKNAESFLEQLQLIKENDFKFILIGNKCDIQKRSVTVNDGLALAKRFNGEYIETSALQNININESFQKIPLMFLNKNEDISCKCKIY